MAKRFTDTDKWKREWFSGLPPLAKLVWLYVLDQCDHCGVWPRNFRRMSQDIGDTITQGSFDAWFQTKFVLIEDDKYWFPSFIEYQQGAVLRETNNAHRPIINFLEKYEFLNKFSVEKKGLVRGLLAPSKGVTRGPGKGKGKVNVFDSILKKECIEECIRVWQQTLDARELQKKASWEESQIVRLLQKHQDPEPVILALMGARDEPDVPPSFVAKKHLVVERLINTPGLFEKCVTWGTEILKKQHQQENSGTYRPDCEEANAI